MAKLDGDFDIDVKRHYRVEAGQDDDYGKVNYRVLTNNGSGFGFYEDKQVFLYFLLYYQPLF